MDFIFDGDVLGLWIVVDNVVRSKVVVIILEFIIYYLIVWEGNFGDKLGEWI